MMIRDYIIIITACLITAGFLVWKELVRENRSELLWRIAASVVAVAGLAGMILPFAYKPAGKKVASDRTAVWLTEGYPVDSLTKFIGAKEKGFSIYTSDYKLLSQYLPSQTSLIADPSFFIDSMNQFRSMHVFGYGFSKDEIRKFDGIPYAFHVSPLPTGICSINWTQQIKSGEAFLIQGSYYNATAASVKIVVNGLHTNLDSVIIPAGKQQVFNLKTLPKHTGRALYCITALTGNDTLESAAIPVEVAPVRPLNILILASTPDFENKFLKNWLFKNSYRLVIRTKISRDKYQKEYLNTPQVKVDRITGALLDKIDVVISDADELTSLSKQESALISNRIETDGLGLILKADSFINRKAFYAPLFSTFQKTGAGQKKVLLQWQEAGMKAHGLPVDNPVLIRKHPGTRSLLLDQGSGIYVSSSIYGSGRIILTTLNNTFNWVLEGNEPVYHSLWSMMIEEAAAKLRPAESWLIEPALPRVGEPVQVKLQSGTPQIPRVMLEKSNMYLKQNNWLPLEWSGIYWPVKPGWHSLVKEDRNSWLYVHEDTDWKTLYAFEKQEQTKKHAAVSRQFSAKPEVIKENGVRQPVPRIYFFLAILISCSYLWWEKKYSSVY